MEPGDKNWATQYLLDPLTEPQPADETGPGSHFRPDSETSQRTAPTGLPQPSKRLSKNNPFRQSHGSPKETSTTTREITHESAYPSPPTSASPRASPSHRQQAFGTHDTRPRRASSLTERFPGDPSVRPLDQLSMEKRIADKSRQRTRKHSIRPDIIDDLDDAGVGRYHHEGPYDATLLARNNSYLSSPVAAVASTNAETLKATPKEKIIDSLEGHRPLDGVAAYAPGETDQNGHVYRYEQGDNMMIDNNPEGGAYKRWPGIQYHPDDIKGKGEPSYSIEEALKKSSLDEKNHRNSLGSEGIEMSSRHRSSSGTQALKSSAIEDDQSNLGRKGSLSDRLKRTAGSLRRRRNNDI